MVSERPHHGNKRLRRRELPGLVERYEHPRPESAVCLDIKKRVRIGRVGYCDPNNRRRREEGITREYVWVTIDDPPQLECTKVLPDVGAPTTTGLFAYAAMMWYITRGGGRAANPSRQQWRLYGSAQRAIAALERGVS